MNSGRRVHSAVAIAVAALTGASHAAIRAQSGSSYLQVLQGHGPSVLAEPPAEFSFFMWVRRTAADTVPMYILEAPGAFAVLVEPRDQSIRLHRGIQQETPIELVLSLQDGNGQVPLGEWILIGASWDGATGDFRAWARSETVTRVDAAGVGSGNPAATPTGDLTLGNPQRGGAAAQQGDYGLIVFRDHAVDGDDFDDVWDSRDYFAAYRLDNLAGGGNLTGDANVAWMAHHSILTNPLETVTGISASAALPGDDVLDDNYCVLTDSHPSSMLLTTVRVTGISTDADAWQFFSPHDDGGSPFFVREIPDVDLPDPPFVAGVAPKIRQFATGAPQQLMRCVVSANSRAMKTSDADNRTWPEHFAHGFMETLLPQVAGVLNRPAKLNGGIRWFGFDATSAPATTGQVLQLTVAGAQRGFARLWTGSGLIFVGPGEGLWMDEDAVFALKTQPEPGSLLIAEAPIVVRTYLLRFPGAGTLSWRPVKSAAQHVNGTFGPADSVDMEPPGAFTRVVGAGDTVDAGSSAITLDGDLAAQVTAGDAIYVSAGPGQRGIAVIAGVTGDGLTTTMTMEHWFAVAPAAGSTLHIGPWEFATIEYQWPALANGDAEQWRGLELTAVGGPLVNFAWDAWRPDVDGFVIGGVGWAGNGYTPQLAESVAAATPLWMQMLEPDIWLQGLAQQSSNPVAMSDYLAAIRAALPDVEIAWLGEGAHMHTSSETWHQYLTDEAAAEGVPAATMVLDDTIGSYLDQAVDGQRNDSAHLSLAGNTLLARGWVAQLEQAARIPADLDGDGTVGIADFLALLAAWGPCPGPPDPCLADADGDGIVGISDFLLLLGVWGSGV